MRVDRLASASNFSVVIFSIVLFAFACPVQAAGTARAPRHGVDRETESSSRGSERDREALALLLAEYSRRISEWAPSAEWLWGVNSLNVIAGYPMGKRTWFSSPKVGYWNRVLLSQGVRQPEFVQSRPNILLMFSDDDCFYVYPGRMSGDPDPKIIVVFGRQFYSTHHVQGVFQGDSYEDLLAAWREPEVARNPRAEAEMVQRLIWMAGEMSHMHFLVAGDNLTRVLSCLDHPESNTRQCADTIWDYEIAAARMVLSVSQSLKFCPKPEPCKDSQLKVVTPPLTMLEFFRSEIDGGRVRVDLNGPIGLRNYLRFLLPRAYKKQAAFFKKYWNQRS